MPKFKLEEFLLPWEHDGEGKKLDEPKEIDVEQLRKYVYGLLEDKDNLRDEIETVKTERDQEKENLATLRREHESEEDRRKREEAEREQRYAKLEADATERRKVEALEEHFKDQGISAARAKRLAKRIPANVDERDWVREAEELVEDGFRISDNTQQQEQQQTGDLEDEQNELGIRPRVRRSNGTPAAEAYDKNRGKTDAEILAEAIPVNTW